MGRFFRNLAAALVFVASPVSAFEWHVRTTLDQGIYSATAEVSGIIWLTCGGEIPGRRGAVPMYYQDSVTPEGTLRLHFAPIAFSQYYPDGPVPGAALVVDAQTYELPDLRSDDYYGSFVTSLPLNAPLITALTHASSLTLIEAGTVRGPISTRGAANSLNTMVQHCATRGASSLTPLPNPAPSEATPQAGVSAQRIDAWARQSCSGALRIEPGAILRADVDGDGREDVALDGSGILCDGMLPHCGASLCSTAVFLTTRGETEPQLVLGYGPVLGRDAQGHPVFEIENRCNDGTVNICGPVRFGR